MTLIYSRQMSWLAGFSGDGQGRQSSIPELDCRDGIHESGALTGGCEVSKPKILNYDPMRYGVPVNEVQPVTITRSDGQVFRILFPAGQLKGKSQDEKNRIVLRTLHIFERLRPVIARRPPAEKRKHTAQEVKQVQDDLITRFAWATARVISINVVSMYYERAATEEVIYRRGEPDGDTVLEANKRVLERIYAVLEKDFQKDQEVSDKLENWHFENLFAHCVLTVLRQQEITGVRFKGSIWEAARDYLRPRVYDVRLEIIEQMAENYGAHILEKLLRPAEWTIEALRAYLEEEAIAGLSKADLINLLKNITNQQAEDIVLRAGKNGNMGIHFHIKGVDEYGPSQSELMRLLEPPRIGRPPKTKQQIEEEKEKYRPFVGLTHRRQDIAECLASFAKRNDGCYWIKMLEHDRDYPSLCGRYQARGYNLAIIEEAAQVLYDYQTDFRLKTNNRSKWDHAVSALTVAQVIASLELDWRNDKRCSARCDRVNKRYSKGGGYDWTIRDDDLHVVIEK